MVKNIFTLLIFSIAVVFSGCSPIGSLLVDSDTGAALEFIRVEPKRFVYSDEYDPFIPADDMDVFGIFGGKEKPIAIKEVEIVISGYPFEDDVIVLKDSEKEEGLQLNFGRKNISISYKGLKTLYRISVGETKTGDDDNDGPSIVIDWKWPED